MNVSYLLPKSDQGGNSDTPSTCQTYYPIFGISLEGKEEGIKTTQLGNIVSLCKKLGCTIEYAMSLLSIPENMREEYKEMLEKEGVALA